MVKLSIRSLQLDDFTAWTESYNQAAPARHRWDQLGWRPAEELSYQRFLDILKTQESMRNEHLIDMRAVWAEGKLVGFVSLKYASQSPLAEIGVEFFNQYWRQGLGTKVLSQIEAHLCYPVICLIGLINPSNQASLAFMRANRFRQLMAFEQPQYGYFTDFEVYVRKVDT